MASGGVTTTGLRELQAAVDRLPHEVATELRKVAEATAKRVLARAQSLVPVDTGYTRDNIHMYEEPEKSQFVVSDGSDRPRQLISLHRMKRSGRMHTQKVTLNMLPVWIERGTRFMSAHPFMRPAGDAENSEYIRASTAAAQAIVDKLGGF